MGPRHHSNPHNTIVMQAFDPQTGTLSPERKTLFTGTPLCYTEGRTCIATRAGTT